MTESNSITTDYEATLVGGPCDGDRVEVRGVARRVNDGYYVWETVSGMDYSIGNETFSLIGRWFESSPIKTGDT